MKQGTISSDLEFRRAAGQGNINLLEEYYSKDIIDNSGDSGKTALHFAAQQGMLEAVKWLVNKDAKPHTQDKEGNTPLHLALLNSQFSLASYLLELSPDVFTKNKNGHVHLVKLILE